MKIIDLLNKIANGELEGGTKFKYDDNYFKYWKTSNSFDRYYDSTYTSVQYYNDNLWKLSDLNNEVEIIEEDKKIEKIHYSVEADIYETCLVKENRGVVATLSVHDPRPMMYLFKEKINELIDEINKLKEK